MFTPEKWGFIANNSLAKFCRLVSPLTKQVSKSNEQWPTTIAVDVLSKQHEINTHDLHLLWGAYPPTCKKRMLALSGALAGFVAHLCSWGGEYAFEVVFKTHWHCCLYITLIKEVKILLMIEQLCVSSYPASWFKTALINSIVRRDVWLYWSNSQQDASKT